ncbi:MAG: VOC family protein [Sedimentibacter sp.]|uniref:VOC family protein n=1 Tax=Sedimentibacter sp. TaxID=1960295 RepID=UPI003158D8CA
MSVSVYLIFDGNCREAVDFYADVFNAEKKEVMFFKDAPQRPGEELPEDAKNRVMHTYLEISGMKFMFSDTFPGTPFSTGNNVSIAVVENDMDKIRSYFNKMKEGGTVDMDLQETFWSKLYGSVTDKFGIPWQFSHTT